MGLYDDVLTKLKENKSYTLLELIDNDLSRIDEVKDVLFSILSNEISSMPLTNKIKKYEYLYKIFSYINTPSNEFERIKDLDNLKTIREMCLKRITDNKTSKKNEKSFKVLNKIINLIDINELYIEHYNNDTKDKKENALYDLLNYLVYDLKKYDYLKECVKNFSNEILLLNKSGRSFVEELLDKYLYEVNLGNVSNILFYEKVMKLFIDEIRFNDKEELLDVLNASLNDYKKEISSADIKEDEKQRIIFYINEITSYLDNFNYDVEDLLNDIHNLIIDMKQVNVKSSDKQFLLFYFNYLIDILINNIYGMNEIHKFNKYGIDISNSLIEKEYKEKVISLNNKVIKYINELNFKYKDTRYLDYKYDIKNISVDELAKASEHIVVDNGECLLDCRNKFIITIDSKRTRVYDDAISIDSYENGNKLLGIYLADAASFIKRGSTLDLYALNLGESVNLYKRYIPMLSYDVVEKLTLVENQDRRAIGYFFLLDKDMNIINYDVKKCLIRVTENFDYDLANSYITNSRNSEEISKLKEMQFISKNMLYKETPGKRYRAMKQLKKTGSLNRDSYNSLSNDMIVNYMVFLNTFIANFFYSNNKPFIYRNNVKGLDSNIKNNIFEITNWDYDYLDVINYMEESSLFSYYSTLNRGHSGLGVDVYCHATNPLRKYSSLEIQRLTEKYMINKNMMIEPNELERLDSLCQLLNLRLDLNREYNSEVMSLNAKTKTLTK